jgi:hypothetical protein
MSTNPIENIIYNSTTTSMEKVEILTLFPTNLTLKILYLSSIFFPEEKW